MSYPRETILLASEHRKDSPEVHSSLIVIGFGSCPALSPALCPSMVSDRGRLAVRTRGRSSEEIDLDEEGLDSLGRQLVTSGAPMSVVSKRHFLVDLEKELVQGEVGDVSRRCFVAEK